MGAYLKACRGVEICCKVATLPRHPGVEVPGEVVPLTSQPGRWKFHFMMVFYLEKNMSIFLAGRYQKTLEF